MQIIILVTNCVKFVHKTLVHKNPGSIYRPLIKYYYLPVDLHTVTPLWTEYHF